MNRARRIVPATLVVALTACTGTAELRTGGAEGPASSEPSSASPSVTPTPSAQAAPEPDLDLARSETREDSYYPEVGDPLVDALHYDLDLAWDPAARTLTGAQTLTFRATEDAGSVRLDLGAPLEVSEATLDGDPVTTSRDGDALLVRAPVRADVEHELRLAYAGSPEPVGVPTTRTDFSSTGWTVTPAGETWTMQEPWGAHTWYAVNDHPSDKALYDVTMRVPAPWTGVSNGELLERTEADGQTTTRWHLAEPAAPYLVTAAFANYEMTEDVSGSGVPLTYWTPRDRPALKAALAVTPEAMDWLEDLLGPYPYDTFGTVVVDSDSAMETQTMVTLGDTPYTTSPEVVVHELAHHWYGNQVTPTDWADLWMNEGMAMYLQGMWEAEQRGVEVGVVMDEWAPSEAQYRAESGPPGAYDRGAFASSNVYYGPALMFHELRERVGDEAFFAMARGWPAANDNGNATRQEFLDFIESSTGEELSDFFDAWLLGETTPSRD
ncbi:M1 family metallopeptidase [Nocardioides nanhaiensis]|uniref:Aminopeptidase N n=1 Tax=Nocardioides nanhaiensis TaxID=1476871 RepID=A0ABP8VR93_9ACTN